MRRLFSATVLALAVVGSGHALEAGGGVSVFVPQSLYLHGQGTISVETNLQYAFGLSRYVSFPVGISYNKIYGYTPEGSPSLDRETAPWFFGDSIMGYAMVKLHVPVSIFYFDLAGGGAVNWNATLTEIGQNIEGYLATSSGSRAAAMVSSSYRAPLGYGWVAQAGAGVVIRKLSVGVTATYRDIRSPLTFSATYYGVDASGTSATQDTYTAPGTAVLIMRGLSIGLSVHVSL